ncbi:MAG: fumarylacetoacetate hydrolase family protein [Candidatus Omnitrophota bacterium]
MKIVRFLHSDMTYEGILESEDTVSAGSSSGGKTFSTGEIKFLPPAQPSKIVCVGLNYADHAMELNMPLQEEPVIFIKPPSAVIGPGDKIRYPGGVTRIDYEAELGVVIKNRIKNVTEDAAREHILGYLCLNDVTARDLQKKDAQWTRAKSFDTFAPVGPWIETDLDTRDLYIRSYLNGELKQDSRTSFLIFKVHYLVSFISRIMTLLPGDIIATGTPPGIGPMEPGDEISIEIEGLGALINKVVREN